MKIKIAQFAPLLLSAMLAVTAFAADSGLKVFNAPEGFSILMEGTPSISENAEAGKAYQHFGADSFYEIRFMRSPVTSEAPKEDVDRFLGLGLTGGILAVNGTEISRKPILLERKYNGLEGDCTLKQGTASGYMRVRIYLIKHRVIQMCVGGPDKTFPCSALADRFLDSLKVSPEKWD